MPDRAARRRKLAGRALGLGLAGAAYAVWLAATGLGVPCLFHLCTGLLCPGCGISRALLALAQGRLALALRCNAAAVVLAPFLGWLLACMARRYVREGTARLSPRAQAAVWAAAVLLVLFGAVRNLPALWFLRPPG